MSENMPKDIISEAKEKIKEHMKENNRFLQVYIEGDYPYLQIQISYENGGLTMTDLEDLIEVLKENDFATFWLEGMQDGSILIKAKSKMVYVER
jgi:chitinase